MDAKRIEERRNGNNKLSRRILFKNHVIGVTAKITEAIKAIFLLYRRSEIL
jgi:hypothetical protein